jgi:hypothetical protein
VKKRAKQLMVVSLILILVPPIVSFFLAFGYGILAGLGYFHPTAVQELSWIWPMGMFTVISRCIGFLFLIVGALAYAISSSRKEPDPG